MKKNPNDEISFTPLTSGLGFNKKHETPMMKNKPVSTRLPQISSNSKTGVAQVSRYSSIQLPEISIDKIMESKEVITKTINVGLFKRFFAWSLDFIFLISLTTMLSLLVNGLTYDFSASIDLISRDVIMNLFLPLFAFGYIFYFTMSEKVFSTSLGKAILNLKVISGNEKKITLDQSFARSSLLLLNIFLCGMIAIYDLHSKWTDTAVVYE